MRAYLSEMSEIYNVTKPYYEWDDLDTGMHLAGRDLPNSNISNIQHHKGSADVEFNISFVISGNPEKIYKLRDKVSELLREIEV